jgi:hypothetical protein
LGFKDSTKRIRLVGGKKVWCQRVSRLLEVTVRRGDDGGKVERRSI